MKSADVVFADGVPAAWFQNRISGKDAKVIVDLELCWLLGVIWADAAHRIFSMDFPIWEKLCDGFS